MIEQDETIKTEILQKFKDLLVDEIILCCKVDRYKEKMTDNIYEFAMDKLDLLTREEFYHMTYVYLRERKKEHYENDTLDNIITPRRSWFFGMRNKAAKLIDKKIAQDAEALFAELKALLHGSDKDAEKTGVKDQSQEDALLNGAITPPAAQKSPQRQSPPLLLPPPPKHRNNRKKP